MIQNRQKPQPGFVAYVWSGHGLHLLLQLQGPHTDVLITAMRNQDRYTSSVTTITVQICTPLDVLHKQVVLLAGNEVRAHDARLHTGRHDAGKDTTESVESTLVRRWHHL